MCHQDDEELTVLADSTVARLRAELLPGLLESPTAFSIGALRARQWVAAPMEERIREPHARSISGEALRRGISHAEAVTTEDEVHAEGVRVSLTPEGLLEFDANCKLRAFLLTSPGRDFALLEEGDYYWILAGPRDFVETALRTKLASAFAAFRDYVDRAWNLPTREFLLEVLERYSVFAHEDAQSKDQSTS